MFQLFYRLWYPFLFCSVIILKRSGNGHVFFDVTGNFVVFVVLLLFLPSHCMWHNWNSCQRGRRNSKKTYCTVCRNFTILKCITSNKKISSNLTQDWMCWTRIQSILPFSKVIGLHVLDSSLINEVVEYQDQHINV